MSDQYDYDDDMDDSDEMIDDREQHERDLLAEEEELEFGIIDDDYCEEYPEECGQEDEDFDPLDMFNPDFDPDDTDEDF